MMRTAVKKTSTLTLRLALVSLLVLVAAPVFAATPDAAAAVTAPELAAGAAGAAPELPLFLPAAEAAMGNGNGNNSCHGQFTEITNYYFFVLSQSECDATCTDWCDGEGGTLVSAFWSARGADCRCSCCVPK